MCPLTIADVDDLKDIGELERYVDQSGAINLFLSRGYFKSRNCLREVQAAVDTQKPFMLTHEAVEQKGGAPLSDIQIELDDAQLRESVFTDGRCMTTWHRIVHFQLVTLKHIAKFTLLQTPLYKKRDSVNVFVPGELLGQRIGFYTPVTVYTPSRNYGVKTVVAELKQAFKGISSTDKLVLRAGAAIHSGEGSGDGSPCKCLLYLNQDSFLNDAGVKLAEELRRVMAVGLPIVLAHENDPKCGGCEFGRFFQITPFDLIEAGLYETLACELYPGDGHREVSLALLAKALGATALKPNSSARQSTAARRRLDHCRDSRSRRYDVSV